MIQSKRRQQGEEGATREWREILTNVNEDISGSSGDESSFGDSGRDEEQSQQVRSQGKVPVSKRRWRGERGGNVELTDCRSIRAIEPWELERELRS